MVKSALREDPIASSGENGPKWGKMGGREDSRRPAFSQRRFLSHVSLD